MSEEKKVDVTDATATDEQPTVADDGKPVATEQAEKDAEVIIDSSLEAKEPSQPVPSEDLVKPVPSASVVAPESPATEPQKDAAPVQPAIPDEPSHPLFKKLLGAKKHDAKKDGSDVDKNPEDIKLEKTEEKKVDAMMSVELEKQRAKQLTGQAMDAVIPEKNP